MQQYFNSERFGPVTFEDKRETICSSQCQPRDIVIIDGEPSDKLRAEIAIDIRLGQGANPIGVAKNMKFK
jgi:hypothetical protein